MAAWAVPQEPLSKRLHSEPSPRRVNPILLLYRRAIEQAFLDAKECKDGEPTELAKESIQWLTAKLDWTRWRNSDGSVRIPPPEIRGELVLTFDHCCRVLEWNPDEIRAHGLPRRPSVHGNHDGLDSIFAAWGKARAVHEAKVARALEQFRRGDCLQCGASF